MYCKKCDKYITSLKHAEYWKNWLCIWARALGLTCPHCENKKNPLEYEEKE